MYVAYLALNNKYHFSLQNLIIASHKSQIFITSSVPTTNPTTQFFFNYILNKLLLAYCQIHVIVPSNPYENLAKHIPNGSFFQKHMQQKH